MNDFHYGLVLLDMLYGVDIDESEYEELGLIAWNLIGNKNIKLYRFCAYPDQDNKITLPCNIVDNGLNVNGGVIEAVTASYEDIETSHSSGLTNYKSFFTENYIEGQKDFKSPYYISGKLLDYQQIGNTLLFDRNYGPINILYKGILMDDDGLPQLTDKEATAIATYIAYVKKYKEGLVTNNMNIINLANTLKQQWLQQCDQARVTYLNQNDMNQILDAKNAFDRAWYNKSYKPIK